MLNLKPEPAVLAVESIEEQGGFYWDAPLGASIVFVVIMSPEPCTAARVVW